MLSEVRIIQGCKRYNKLAQKELYNRYVPVFWPICLRYANNEDDAKDIMQEGFVKIYSKIKQFKGEGSFEGWMKRIMINTAISYYKKNVHIRNQRNIDEINEMLIKDNKQDYEYDNSEIDIKDIDQQNINYQLVDEASFTEEDLLIALNQIPEGYRAVFNLYHIEELKHKDIAHLLKIDENTSRSRLSRAKNLLQKELFRMSVEKLGR